MSAFRFATASLKENQISILYTAQIINMSHDSCFWTWAETYCVRRESWASPQNTPNNKLPSFKIQLSGEISALKCFWNGARSNSQSGHGFQTQADLEDLKKRLKEAETQDAELKRHCVARLLPQICDECCPFSKQKRSRIQEVCCVFKL